MSICLYVCMSVCCLTVVLKGHLVTHGLAMGIGAARTAHLAYEKLGENAE